MRYFLVLLASVVLASCSVGMDSEVLSADLADQGVVGDGQRDADAEATAFTDVVNGYLYNADFKAAVDYNSALSVKRLDNKPRLNRVQFCSLDAAILDFALQNMRALMADVKHDDDARDALVLRTCYIMRLGQSLSDSYEDYKKTANINTCLQEGMTRKRDFYLQLCAKDKVESIPNKG